jgi:hypothetical protein
MVRKPYRGGNMKYDDALKAWGALKLRAYRSEYVELEFEAVTVTMEFSEGFACCGGSNPGCYCSLVEAPKAEVSILGLVKAPAEGSPYRTLSREISLEDFDFASVLKEICEAGGGVVEVS